MATIINVNKIKGSPVSPADLNPFENGVADGGGRPAPGPKVPISALKDMFVDQLGVKVKTTKTGDTR